MGEWIGSYDGTRFERLEHVVGFEVDFPRVKAILANDRPPLIIFELPISADWAPERRDGLMQKLVQQQKMIVDSLGAQPS